MTATDVGFYVHPLANEVCDGLNTDCGDDGVWQASDSNSTLEEDDADDDGYLECLNAFTPAEELGDSNKARALARTPSSVVLSVEI